MKLNKKHIGITTLLGATAIASVFAAGVTDTTSSTGATRSFGKFTKGQNETDNAEHKAKMAASLASALGTTAQSIVDQLNAGKSPRDIIKASGLDEATVKAQLEASREADMKARLAADVASGKITQAQADLVLTNMKNHEGKGGPRSGKMNHQMLTDVASILGITKDALQTQITAGKDLKDIITASGISETDFRTKMDTLRKESMKTKLAADVAAGTLTQAQADEKLAKMESHKGFRHGKKGTDTTTTNQ